MDLHAFLKKVIVIKLGLQAKPGEHDLAEAIMALQPCWHPFIFFIRFQAYFTSFSPSPPPPSPPPPPRLPPFLFPFFPLFLLLFSCFVSSVRLLFALLAQMDLRLPIYRSALCTAGQKHCQFHRPRGAWITDIWRRENTSRYSHHPKVDWWPSGTTAGTVVATAGSVIILPPLQGPRSLQLSALHLPLSVPRLSQPANASCVRQSTGLQHLSVP